MLHNKLFFDSINDITWAYLIGSVLECPPQEWEAVGSYPGWILTDFQSMSLLFSETLHINN